MSEIYNMYCDESCHLPNDGNKIMVLGGIWCPKYATRVINEQIRAIKDVHSISSEMKWVKVSSSKEDAYVELVNHFFDNKDLHFRVLVIDNKNALNNEKFGQSHDDWYYKMYFNMLKTILDPCSKYNIYLDIKDTKSKTKLRKLKEVLSNNMYDFSQDIINNIQVIRSNEVEIMQIVDILIGAIAYEARGFDKVESKDKIIRLVKERSSLSLKKNSLYRESKFNIFHMQLEESSYGKEM